MNKLYYISQGEYPQDHLNNIEQACEVGCRLIQLRLKDISTVEYMEYAEKAKVICTLYGTTLIVNDSVEAAIASDAAGIHVGKNDKSATEVRKILGDKIIGGTANTLEDCIRLIGEGVDYIGLGPFRFTETKKVLDPILGLEGYRKITSELATQGHSIPIYAIGGIKTEDITSIIETGVYGISISGLLTGGDDLKERMNEIQKAI